MDQVYHTHLTCQSLIAMKMSFYMHRSSFTDARLFFQKLQCLSELRQRNFYCLSQPSHFQLGWYFAFELIFYFWLIKSSKGTAMHWSALRFCRQLSSRRYVGPIMSLGATHKHHPKENIIRAIKQTNKQTNKRNEVRRCRTALFSVKIALVYCSQVTSKHEVVWQTLGWIRVHVMTNHSAFLF